MVTTTLVYGLASNSRPNYVTQQNFILPIEKKASISSVRIEKNPGISLDKIFQDSFSVLREYFIN